jgi:ABC-2 type transport system permease protein
VSGPGPPPAEEPPHAFRALLRLQWRLALREPAGIAFGLGVPIFLFLIFGLVPVFRQGTIPGTDLNAFELYIPILLVTSLILVSLVGLAPPLVRDREIGWLRRLSTTPVRVPQLLAAQVAIYLVVVAVVTVVFIVGGMLFTGDYAVPQLGGFLLSVVLATAAMFALGLLLAAVASDQKAMQRLTPAAMYPLLFFSGLYFPLQYLPGPIQTIGNYTPMGAAALAMTDAIENQFPSPVALGVTAAYAVVFGALAVRFFRWE